MFPTTATLSSFQGVSLTSMGLSSSWCSSALAGASTAVGPGAIVLGAAITYKGYRWLTAPRILGCKVGDSEQVTLPSQHNVKPGLAIRRGLKANRDGGYNSAITIRTLLLEKRGFLGYLRSLIPFGARNQTFQTDGNYRVIEELVRFLRIQVFMRSRSRYTLQLMKRKAVDWFRDNFNCPVEDYSNEILCSVVVALAPSVAELFVREVTSLSEARKLTEAEDLGLFDFGQSSKLSNFVTVCLNIGEVD